MHAHTHMLISIEHGCSHLQLKLACAWLGGSMYCGVKSLKNKHTFEPIKINQFCLKIYALWRVVHPWDLGMVCRGVSSPTQHYNFCS